MRTFIVLLSIAAVVLDPAGLKAEDDEPLSPETRNRARGGETSPAPLVMAVEKDKGLTFQIGADAFGGLALGGAQFVGGVNATLVYPVIDLLWVGIRPSLHYVYDEDSEYEVTWFHPEVAVQVNFLHDPLRVYLLAAGGYAAALDGDLYRGLAHGWGVLGGLGVSWQPQGELGLFLELGFRAGAAGKQETVLDLDAEGNPQCVDQQECLSYLT